MQPIVVTVLTGAILVFSFSGYTFATEEPFQVTECLLKGDALQGAREYADGMVDAIKRHRGSLTNEEKEQLWQRYYERLLSDLGKSYLVIESLADCPSGMSPYRAPDSAYSDK